MGVSYVAGYKWVLSPHHSKRAGIPQEKTIYAIRSTGNSGGSTVAVALAEAVNGGRIRPGQIVALVSFGVGLSWGGVLVRWPSDFLGPMHDGRQFEG